MALLHSPFSCKSVKVSATLWPGSSSTDIEQGSGPVYSLGYPGERSHPDWLDAVPSHQSVHSVSVGGGVLECWSVGALECWNAVYLLTTLSHTAPLTRHTAPHSPLTHATLRYTHHWHMPHCATLRQTHHWHACTAPHSPMTRATLTIDTCHTHHWHAPHSPLTHVYRATLTIDTRVLRHYYAPLPVCQVVHCSGHVVPQVKLATLLPATPRKLPQGDECQEKLPQMWLLSNVSRENVNYQRNLVSP